MVCDPVALCLLYKKKRKCFKRKILKNTEKFNLTGSEAQHKQVMYKLVFVLFKQIKTGKLLYKRLLNIIRIRNQIGLEFI